jgi:uracil-DNA glycosylase
VSWELPLAWRKALASATSAPGYADLVRFVDEERASHSVYPPAADVFRALEMTRFEDVRVVLLGQDPYHDEGQAHGLSFSVRRGVRPPPSLVNVFRELEGDLALPRPEHGDLSAWAERGVLLLNTVLTVRAHEPGSHQKRGWESFTDAVIDELSARDRPMVFLLWGSNALRKQARIDRARHAILGSAHPSPLSAHRGFLGSRPFSGVNRELERLGQPPIDWSL